MLGAFDENQYLERQAKIAKAFSPAAPIRSRELFAGRRAQMASVLAVANQAGQHAAIYGDRGVGKTSLARVVQLLIGPDALSVYYTCSGSDTFESIWRGALGDLTVVHTRRRPGFGAVDEEIATAASRLLADDDVSPDLVRRALALLSDQLPFLVFIDEFDRVHDERTQARVADVIKIVSDHVIPATIVLVGVGDTIDDLVREHSSIQRSMVQVHMPRMTEDELGQIVSSGMEAAEMTVDRAFVTEVALLSQGMPHYAHLIGQQAAFMVLDKVRVDVTARDLEPAIERALENVSQTVRQKYHNATFSSRATLYAEVLLACALAAKDDLGFFSAPGVRDRLQDITKQPYDLPSFAAHLKDFSGDGPRGGILAKRGHTRHFRYRFEDPLFPPYVVMKGRAEGLLPE